MLTPSNNTQLCALEKSFEKITEDIICNHIGSDSRLIGLGSGRAVSKIVNSLSDAIIKNCEFICTSIQIKIDAEKKGLKVLDEIKIPFLDLVIDGADQIDKDFFMIKGGGGALLREKILYHSSKKTIIIGDFSKFVHNFSMSLPLEVLPFGRTAVISFLTEIGGKPVLRTLEKGYPYLTENGNIILDTLFNDYDDVMDLEKKIQKIPGILETGFFIKPASVYYKALEDGYFQIFDKFERTDLCVRNSI
ncbi:MAG: ribose 5-phosphate isomerase A [Thermoproteota archaeon]|nr:ribose 5-phosphate isomerase A [Thermoproteota archaeon]